MEHAGIPPLVSVVIPVYNGVNYLGEAVESVFAQTYPTIELIVVDDGSTDGTWTLIQSYGRRVDAVHKENGGVASALNMGIRRARGQLVAWLSHDDMFLPDKISRQVRFLTEHPEFGLCYTDFELISASGESLRVFRVPWYPGRELAHRFLKDMHINGSTVLMRKACFESVGGFNEGLPHTQDMDMWLRIADRSELGHLPEVLVRFRSHQEQGSMNFEVQISEEQALFRELFERLGPVRFFPQLEHLSDPAVCMARGLNMFADELRASRGWYRFALGQYRRSNILHPALATHWKMLQSWTSLVALGDERESLTLGRRARIHLGLGQGTQARSFSVAFFLRHPLRLDMLVIWLASWLPWPVWRALRTVKRRLVS